MATITERVDDLEDRYIELDKRVAANTAAIEKWGKVVAAYMIGDVRADAHRGDVLRLEESVAVIAELLGVDMTRKLPHPL